MFLLDANIFVEAKNRYHGFDFAPGFWTWLELAHKYNLVCSIEEVKKKLHVVDDELSNWAQINSEFFREIDTATTQHFSTLISWASTRDYSLSAQAEFASGNADFLLISYAKEHSLTLVTHEKSSPSSKKRILIPDACAAMDVRVSNTFEMLRHSGVRLGLLGSSQIHPLK